ncbi:MAG: hypothetical protein GKS00_18710 [Alphaproteobacteria bacterium]|nr:hypothetical protein [Alphaproteobacteria bacterium]
MGSNFVLVIVLCLSIIAGGCSSPFARKPLNPELSGQNLNLTVYSTIPKEQVSTQFNAVQLTISSPNIGVAIIGAFAAATVNTASVQIAEKRARNRMSPVWQSSADFDFRREYWNKLEPIISKSPWFTVTSLEKLGAVTEKEAEEFKLPLLILKVFFDLSSTFQVLTVQTQASLYTTNPDEREFFAIYTYYSDKIGPKSEATALWAADNAAALRQEARFGIEQNLKMIRYDLLQNPTNKNVETGKEIIFPMRDTVTGSLIELTGNLIEESEKRILMRVSIGNIFSLSTGLKE